MVYFLASELAQSVTYFPELLPLVDLVGIEFNENKN